MILRTHLDRACQDLVATAWRLERQAGGRPGLPERGEADLQERWPPVCFASDFDTAAAMLAELRAYGSVLGEIAGAVRALGTRLKRWSLLVEDEPEAE